MAKKELSRVGGVLALAGRILLDHLFHIAVFFTILAVFGYVLAEKITQYSAIVISTAALLVLTYLDCWRSADRDKRRAQLGQTQADSYRGMKAAAISQLPGLGLSLLILMQVPSKIPLIAYRWLYIGLFIPVQSIADAGFSAALFLPCVLTWAAAALGYGLGHRQIRIINHTYYKNAKNKKAGRK